MSASPPSICSTGRPLATCSRWPGVDAAAAAAAVAGVAGFGAAAAAAGVAAAVQGGGGAAGAEFRELMHRFEAAAAGVRQGGMLASKQYKRHVRVLAARCARALREHVPS